MPTFQQVGQSLFDQDDPLSMPILVTCASDGLQYYLDEDNIFRLVPITSMETTQKKCDNVNSRSSTSWNCWDCWKEQHCQEYKLDGSYSTDMPLFNTGKTANNHLKHFSKGYQDEGMSNYNSTETTSSENTEIALLRVALEDDHKLMMTIKDISERYTIVDRLKMMENRNQSSDVRNVKEKILEKFQELFFEVHKDCEMCRI